MAAVRSHTHSVSSAKRVTHSIWRDCEEWADIADALERLAASDVPGESQLGRDNAAAVVGDNSKAVRSYTTNRADNAARFRRELHSMVLAKQPGKLSLNYTALYPLLRGALEDAAAILWLVAPVDKHERLLRILRML